MEYIWTTKDGVKINVNNMDTNHLRNALKMCMRIIKAQQVQVQVKPKEYGELAQEHADAYEVYKATGYDMLNDNDEYGF